MSHRVLSDWPPGGWGEGCAGEGPPGTVQSSAGGGTEGLLLPPTTAAQAQAAPKPLPGQ